MVSEKRSKKGKVAGERYTLCQFSVREAECGWLLVSGLFHDRRASVYVDREDYTTEENDRGRKASTIIPVMFLCALANCLGEEKYLQSAKKAGNYALEHEVDGNFTKAEPWIIPMSWIRRPPNI